jgi:hypothetical protein
MTQTSRQGEREGSRLVQLLSDLTASEAKVSHRYFSDKLGQLVDLSDSVALADKLRRLGKAPFVAAEEEARPVPQQLRMDFIASRNAMVESIIKKFTASPGNMPFRLPQPKAELLESASAAEPYLKAYLGLQGELEAQVQKLRVKLRQALTQLSPALAQLAALDAALGDTLALQTRKQLMHIPRLLGSRFQTLRQQVKETAAQHNEEPELHSGKTELHSGKTELHSGKTELHSEKTELHSEKKQLHDVDSWMQNDGWLNQFLSEMQSVILAELELRLQPVMGLLEALDEEGRHTV